MEDFKEKETVLKEITTECEHTWTLADPDKNSDLVSLACANCWSGISVAKENLHKYYKA